MKLEVDKLLSVEELDERYVVVTNIYTYPLLVTKSSSLLSDIDCADYSFDESVPKGKGKVYKFSEGMKIWGKKGIDREGKDCNICPSPVSDEEKNCFKKDKDSIVAYAKKLGLSEIVVDTLIAGCDGYPSSEGESWYDEKGKRIIK